MGRKGQMEVVGYFKISFQQSPGRLEENADNGTSRLPYTGASVSTGHISK
jgi:hypothetical protein